MTEPEFNPRLQVKKTVYTATKAVWAAAVVTVAAIALFVKAIGDGDLSLDEGLEVLGIVVGIPAAYGAVYRAENKPKRP